MLDPIALREVFSVDPHVNFGTVAGLRSVEGAPGLENVDLGFPAFSDYFDEPKKPDFTGDRIAVGHQEEKKESAGSPFTNFKKNSLPSANGSLLRQPPAIASTDDADDNLLIHHRK
ncbi:unnamed protein product [Cyclocybe aegerita]|uniref:Uncharacterized protein n=1 Tax=Cyclocybe aegerita TaxID=1973307 RepID=A0A8S0XFB5_CYCAE|nr:unnamed protein product [Cyclocybe aegerita]